MLIHPKPAPLAHDLPRALFSNYEFVDIAMQDTECERFDVIIPVLHSNDLWRENLKSYFREIPINQILIGDAGCIDQTVSIAKEFPRVQIIDHSHLKTLGSSIADLISKVSTDKFIYLQSDVYLPEAWLNKVSSELMDADWVSTPQQIVVMIDYLLDYQGIRPMSGAQMGRKRIFEGIEEFIDDDFVYRNEEYVLSNFVIRSGGKSVHSSEGFHFHQVMRRITTGMEMNVQEIQIKVQEKQGELTRVNETQLFGIIKYCDVSDLASRTAAESALIALLEIKSANIGRILAFAKLENPIWNGFLIQKSIRHLIRRGITAPTRSLKRIKSKLARFSL